MIDLRSQTVHRSNPVQRESALLATRQRAIRHMRFLYFCDILIIIGIALIALAVVVGLFFWFTNSPFRYEVHKVIGRHTVRGILAAGALPFGILLHIKRAIVEPRFEKARTELALTEAVLEEHYHYDFDA